jgi:Flp pilus assembly protein TadG
VLAYVFAVASLCNNVCVRKLGGLRARGSGCAPFGRAPSRGAAAVEFALFLPFFCTLLFGMIDYGWYFYQRFALSAAVRDGIRAGLSVLSTATPDDSWTTATKRIKIVLQNSNAIDPSLVSFGPAAGSRYTGAVPSYALTVSAAYTFQPLIGLVPVPHPTMNYSMTMLLELEN